MMADAYIDLLAFQDREGDLDLICSQEDWPIVLNVFGEAGIGKTRLLKSVQHRLESGNRDTLVMYIDLENSEGNPNLAIDNILHEITNGLPERIDATWQNPEQVAGVLVSELSRLARTQKKKIMLLFDTTEQLQTEMKFWTWLEVNLVGPLVLDGGIRQVFAGRTAAPWRRIEVRRKLQTLCLKKLPYRINLRGLAISLLTARGMEWDEPKLENILVDLIETYGFGHPRLSIALGEKIISDWNTRTLAQYLEEKSNYEKEICQKVIEKFIAENFLKNVPEPWKTFLWWLCPLEEHFDLIFVKEYLNKVLRDEVKNHPEHFYIQGLFELRIIYSVLQKDPAGEYFNGVIGEVMRRCFRVLRPADYAQACQQIAATYADMIKNYLADDVDESAGKNELVIKYEGYSKGATV